MRNDLILMNKNDIEEIKNIYLRIQKEIMKRLDEFNQLWESGTELDIFSELVFCLLTPQSKAKSCWAAVENLQNKNLLINGHKDQITEELYGVRFKYTKAANIIEARKLFVVGGDLTIKLKLEQLEDPYIIRDWLVKNIKGMGNKEASHFLRNIGKGTWLAILDRHILKNLKALGVINNIPNSIPIKQYLEIEKKMSDFAKKIDIPLTHMDLLLWYKETGVIFK